MKRLLKSAANTAGILGLVSRFAPERVSIFCYHGFRPAGPAGSPLETRLMPVNQFEKQLKLFRRYGTPTSLEDLLKPVAEISGRRVVITIDDGYASTFDHAFPILQKYDWPATVFLPTGFVDRESLLWTDWLEFLIWKAPNVSPAFRWNGSTVPLALYSATQRRSFIAQQKSVLKGMPISDVLDWLKSLERHIGITYDWSSVPPLLQPLTWDQVRVMRASGLISVGSHTVSHPILSNCPADGREAELLDSKHRIETELGAPCHLFAYPHAMLADITSETESAVRKAGYSLAVTMESGHSRVAPFQPFRVSRWGAGIPSAELAYLVSGASSLSA